VHTKKPTAREQGRIRFCALILYFVKKFAFFETFCSFLANNIVFCINLSQILSKNSFVKIKNKRTKPDTSQSPIVQTNNTDSQEDKIEKRATRVVGLGFSVLFFSITSTRMIIDFSKCL